MPIIEPKRHSEESLSVRRAWLASILLRSQQSWFGRFAWQLRRLATMGRGQRRRLQRKAAVSLAGAALVLSLGANLMQPVTVHAASITVDDGVVGIADDGQCSIVEAIISANDDSAVYATAGECDPGSGADTINLPTNGLFTLDAAYLFSYYSDTGLPNIDTEITIEGNGSEISRDVNGASFRIMAVSATGDLTLNNTTISNGHSFEDGGGLYVVGDALVQGSTFSDNYAADDGGAIEVDEGGSLIIDSSTVEFNEADELGGGISAESGATLTIRNGTVITENYAIEGGGGVVADASGLVTIDNSTISDNETGYFGGGIATYATEIVIQNNTTISGNETFEYGGGADFYYSDVTITDSTISGNYSFYEGGGLHLDGSVVTIERSTIDDNHTAAYGIGFFGGGIFNGSLYNNGDYCEDDCDSVPGNLTIIDSTISGNSAWAGGGIFNAYDAVATIEKSTISDNTAAYGGGFLNNNGIWSIANSTLSGNRAEIIDGAGGYGGAVFNFRYSSQEEFEATIALSTLTGNYAEVEGGGVYIYSGPLVIVGSIVSGNTAIGLGNEIYNYSDNNFGVYSGFNVLGHNGETTAEALVNVTPYATDIVATSNGTLPTALTAILDTTLADNGGPTLTHALVADSPAVDYVPDTVCDPATPVGDLTMDQRSEPRNIDIPGMGNDGGNEVCDVGAYELQLPGSGAFCPVEDENIAYLRTDAIGVGQGGPSKGFRTRKLVIPNADELSALYGQLAAVDIGLMKYVRFLPQGYPKIQIHEPTSLAYRPYAVDWWGTDLPTDVNWVKGQFFWGKKGNKAPRAFVLWPTYETEELYANVFTTFDESSENHAAWEPLFIPTQTQTVEIPEVQEDGATVNVTVALADVNKDDRAVVLTVEAGGVSEERVLSEPNRNQSLNLEVFELTGVEAGTDEVVITLDSPLPGVDFPAGGDSAAMIGAAVNYVCGEEPIPPAPRPDAPATDAPVQSSFWSSIATRFAQLRAQPAPELRDEAGENGRFWQQSAESRGNGRPWAERGADK